MDARISKGRLPTRHLTEEGRPANGVLHPPAIGREYGIKFDAAEIFKKTPCVADLKPRGRYVAKDMVEVTDIPPLLHTPLGFDADVGTLNVKLTDAERAERKTKGRLRATNRTSDALGKYAQQIGPAVDGTVTHPGGAHEKQYYADV